MQTTLRAPRQGSEHLMWITPQRVFYAGLLGAVGQRNSGAWNLYVSPTGQPNRVKLGQGPWQAGEVIVVAPQTSHRIESAQALVLTLVVESEYLDPSGLPPLLRHSGAVHAPDFARRVRAMHQHLLAASDRHSLDGFDFDALFFGHALPGRTLDARVEAVIERVNADPSTTWSAQQCAADVQLSFSRFLHLFKAQTGMTFRAFRAWKRARSLLGYVRESASLTDIALSAGYPDATHFSHSIRQFYGLTPSDIVAGSRRLTLHHAGAVVR